ncbi:MAG: hypothetical protein V2A69_06280, partial [Pseudomonadota bacterium]
MQTKTFFFGLVFIFLLSNTAHTEEKKPLSTPFGPVGGNQSKIEEKSLRESVPDNQESYSIHPATPAYTPTATATVPAAVDKSSSTSPSPEESIVSPEEQPQPSDQEGSVPKKEALKLSQTSDEIVFNFDNADINEVINTISEILGINYVSDPRVAGVVNIHTHGKLSKKDLFAVLETLLKINNFTIIKKGELYHIVPLANANQEYISPQLSMDKENLPLSDTLIMQILPLKYVAAEEMANILKPLLLQGGQTIAKDNLLILLDFSSNLKKILPLIDLFDVDIFERLHMQLYEVKNADVEELVLDIGSIFQAFKIPIDNPRAGGVTVVPILRLNMLLAVSANDQHLEKAMEWAKKLDSEVSETELKIFVYFVQNGKAIDISNVLNQVFLGTMPLQTTQFQSQLRETRATTTQMQTQAQQQQQRQLQQRQKQTQPGQTQAQRQQALSQARRSGQSGQSGQLTKSVLTGEAQIVVDESTNALIIQATERDYRTIEKTLKKLDVYPKQVLIEVLIAEIRLDDELKLGVEWEYMNEMSSANYTVTASGVKTLAEEITSGLQYMIDKTGRFKSTLQAFAAKDRINILSSPHIIASDNKEAIINITEEIPIVSGSVT